MLAAVNQNSLGSICNINNIFLNVSITFYPSKSNQYFDSISLLCVKLKINCKEYCKGCGKQNQRYAVNDIARQFLAT